jgi:hypothetical protein
MEMVGNFMGALARNRYPRAVVLNLFDTVNPELNQ